MSVRLEGLTLFAVLISPSGVLQRSVNPSKIMQLSSSCSSSTVLAAFDSLLCGGAACARCQLLLHLQRIQHPIMRANFFKKKDFAGRHQSQKKSTAPRQKLVHFVTYIDLLSDVQHSDFEAVLKRTVRCHSLTFGFDAFLLVDFERCQLPSESLPTSSNTCKCATLKFQILKS